MGSDSVAVAFAAWVDAHKKQLDAERRLAVAQEVTSTMGTYPPQVLLDEVAEARIEAAKLLDAAERAMKDRQG